MSPVSRRTCDTNSISKPFCLTLDRQRLSAFASDIPSNSFALVICLQIQRASSGSSASLTPTRQTMPLPISLITSCGAVVASSAPSCSTATDARFTLCITTRMLAVPEVRSLVEWRTTAVGDQQPSNARNGRTLCWLYFKFVSAHDYVQQRQGSCTKRDLRRVGLLFVLWKLKP